MTSYSIRVYSPGRVSWLIACMFIGPALIMVPVALAADSLGATIIPMLLFTIVCIWFYYSVCSIETEWRTNMEGIFISVKAPNKFFDFGDIFIRWDDITSYKISDKILIIPGFHFWKLEVYTFSGNDLVLNTGYYSEFSDFLKEFKTCAAENSPFLKTIPADEDQS